MEKKIRAALKAGKKMNAIRAYRLGTNCSLVKAKDEIEKRIESNSSFRRAYENRTKEITRELESWGVL